MERTLTTERGDIIIRPARQSDAEAFRELRLEALKNHPAAFSADYEVNRARPPGYWTDRLHLEAGDHQHMIYFAFHGDNLIGMTGVDPGNSPKTRHSAFIWGVYVRPDWRGLHIAESLLAACAEWAREHGVKILKLGVSTANASAIRSYIRAGFHVYGVEPQALCLDGTYYDELLMARTI